MRSFKTPKGTELPLMDIKGKPYLSVQHRVMWFREVCPDHTIETEFVYIKENEALAKATIKDPSGRILATSHKCEDRKGFADFIEKSESSAVGRALGFLGYGTQFALDLEEGDRLADAPTNEKITIFENVKINDQGNIQGITSEEDQDPGSYVVTFGKHKGKTVGDIVKIDGAPKLNSYIHWLENDAKTKKKAISDDAQNFIDAACAYMGHSELDKSIFKPSDKNLSDKLSRLKNEYPGYEPEEPFPEPPPF